MRKKYIIYPSATTFLKFTCPFTHIRGYNDNNLKKKENNRDHRLDLCATLDVRRRTPWDIGNEI